MPIGIYTAKTIRFHAAGYVIDACESATEIEFWRNKRRFRETILVFKTAEGRE
jgi:hypothetical protein